MSLPQILENVSLKDHSTMRLGGNARYICQIDNPHQIGAAIDWAESQKLPITMIGGGSNVIWSDAGFPGLVMVNRIPGYELQDEGDHLYIVAGAGEKWDTIVAESVYAGYSGIEQLSLIPGTVGATPIQNVGAYGREIADVLVCVQAYDRQQKKLVVIPKSECNFSYRNSRFKNEDKGRFFITSVTLSLTKGRPAPPYYDAIKNYLDEHGVKGDDVTAQTIRDAVIAIRNSKLPDPEKIANCGSFFHNPIIPLIQAQEIRELYPHLVFWQVGDDQAKISAGWLLEQLGLKGYHEPNTGMAVWDKQALVFINEKATTTAQLIAFRDAIVKSVQDKFGITLVQEPEMI